MGARKNQLLRILVFILLLLQYCLQISLTLVDAKTTVHVVYMGEKKYEDPDTLTKSHHKILSTLLGSKEAAKRSIIYSYKHGFSGFAARLTETQAKKIAEHPEVLRVIPNGILQSHTTRSWDFMGLNYPSPSSKNLLTESNMGKGTIIGVIDSGVWPESESFNDEGMDPVPSHWRGICQEGKKFNSSICNKKLIGARYFVKGIMEHFELHGEFLSPRDANGHGTHTASTAAGYFVEKANYEGLATGLARGGAPLAHLAIYKACWLIGQCRSSDADLLKAFDKAIHDGVDVISVSIGNGIPLPSHIDQSNSIAIGSFHAISKGIPVVASAGNDGPTSQTIGNDAPWIITVGATTSDRNLPTAITLGNKQILWGQSMDSGKSNHRFTSLAYSELVAVDSPRVSASDCQEGSLNATLAAGKIILCFSATDAQDMGSAAVTVKNAGGIGLIFAQSYSDLLFPCGFILCIKVDFEVGTQILNYIRRASSPVAKLGFPKTVIGNLASPRVASFSSRGPGSLSPSVLKPDIVAPGVDILAAYPALNSKRTNAFEFMSGTSMACPHVSGIVALIKSTKRDWSPAAIRSALVTTASQTGKDGVSIFELGSSRKPADPFDMGGGFVNPNKAMDPGLVYDITPAEYIQFLCSMGHNNKSISRQLMTTASCKRNNHMRLNLNLPSITIPGLSKTVTVTRKVTNVGHIHSIYKAVLEPPYGIKMSVEPQVLSFNVTNKIMSFKVTFSAQEVRGGYTFGSLTWTDGEHFVRSPVAVRAVKFGSNYEV
ncbi:Subtilisin-like protease [Melia azedarach]|uniref:Subtilisin-like protease n=1 Tax=Melia azedarach TaxID=155640 RepID=A0ACC1YFQ7_MELAZ|nr:Subtilisin-like protease [Melia azedarach]